MVFLNSNIYEVFNLKLQVLPVILPPWIGHSFIIVFLLVLKINLKMKKMSIKTQDFAEVSSESKHESFDSQRSLEGER